MDLRSVFSRLPHSSSLPSEEHNKVECSCCGLKMCLCTEERRKECQKLRGYCSVPCYEIKLREEIDGSKKKTEWELP